MLWIKAFHIIFVVTWFAGLFYLPRIFIYHRMTENQEGLDRFVVMERKLMAITILGGLLAVIFGTILIIMVPGYLQQGWLQVKLLLVTGLIGFQYYCYKIMQQFINGKCRHSDKWLRFFNEIPAVILIIVVVLAVTRPF